MTVLPLAAGVAPPTEAQRTIGVGGTFGADIQSVADLGTAALGQEEEHGFDFLAGGISTSLSG